MRDSVKIVYLRVLSDLVRCETSNWLIAFKMQPVIVKNGDNEITLRKNKLALMQ